MSKNLSIKVHDDSVKIVEWENFKKHSPGKKIMKMFQRIASKANVEAT